MPLYKWLFMFFYHDYDVTEACFEGSRGRKVRRGNDNGLSPMTWTDDDRFTDTYMHHKVLVNCIRIITFQIHFWDIRITCIQRTHLELDEVLSVWCVRGPPASRLCNGLPSIYSCLPVIILHNCLKSVPSDTWCHQEYVDGHISARWSYIFRMDIWLQIYHLYQYSYKGHRHETLPVGACQIQCKIVDLNYYALKTMTMTL